MLAYPLECNEFEVRSLLLHLLLISFNTLSSGSEVSGIGCFFKPQQ